MIVDACHTTMACEDDMTWGEDVINSPYKYAAMVKWLKIVVKRYGSL